jgi:hypothetical protein
MAKKEEVDDFLRDFQQKKKIYGIRFRDDRDKNLQTLLNLEVSSNFRETIIDTLSHLDYLEGPLTDSLNCGAPLWVFGKHVKKKEIYIKISIGTPNRNVICISFHEASHKFSYPFK